MQVREVVYLTRFITLRSGVQIPSAPQNQPSTFVGGWFLFVRCFEPSRERRQWRWVGRSVATVRPTNHPTRNESFTRFTLPRPFLGRSTTTPLQVPAATPVTRKVRRWARHCAGVVLTNLVIRIRLLMGLPAPLSRALSFFDSPIRRAGVAAGVGVGVTVSGATPIWMFVLVADDRGLLRKSW